MLVRTRLAISFICVPFLLAGAAYAAGDINEVEPDDPIGSAQLVSVATSGTIDAFLGDHAGDLDYYTFYASAGDVLTVDIDGAFNWATTARLDTVIAIFDPSDNYNILRADDDAPTLDPGSASRRDARIDNFVVVKSGYYTVGVSNYPRFFKDGGSTATGYAGTGNYELIISGASPAIKQIAIDIKPGDDGTAPINLKSRGKIPVAILGGPDFNALNIDPKSLTFGSTGTEHSLAKCDWSGTDVNNDGVVDVVCHFSNQKAAFEPADIEGTLRGRTNDGIAFEGKGFLKVVPPKTKN